LGLAFERLVTLPGSDEVLRLHAVDFIPPSSASDASSVEAGSSVAVSRRIQTYRGSCHCGAVRFEIDTDFPELTTCDCSLCRRKNALMVKVHETGFRLIAGENALSEYRFHTMTARHFFCKTCGIYPFHRKRVTPDYFGINVFCLEGFDPAGVPVRKTVGAAMT